MDQRDHETENEKHVARHNELAERYEFLKRKRESLTKEIIDLGEESPRWYVLKKKLELNYSSLISLFVEAYKFDNHLESEYYWHESDRITCFLHQAWKDECESRHNNSF